MLGLAFLLYTASLCILKISVLFPGWILAEPTGLAQYLGTYPSQLLFCFPLG